METCSFCNGGGKIDIAGDGFICTGKCVFCGGCGRRRITGIRRLWKWFLARFRLSMKAVCEMSVGRQLWDDFHDYPDDAIPSPAHFVTLKCKRCGKTFTM